MPSDAEDRAAALVQASALGVVRPVTAERTAVAGVTIVAGWDGWGI